MTTEPTDARSHGDTVAPGIHVVAKPIGPVCNLNCEYCFYLEKKALFGPRENYRMPDRVLAAFIRGYIEAQPTPAVEFTWQGGEPTLLGIDFFKRVVELQKPFTRRKTITNSLQTNGTLLTDKWCAFLKKNGFLVGISLDGPGDVHDRYRRDRKGEGSFYRVMRGLRMLQKHGVEYNVLASVARETARKPLEVYRFFKAQGVEFIQFVPIIERLPSSRERTLGFNLAGPALLTREETNVLVTPWTVLPEAYGDFLISIYEEWVRQDVGTTFVMNFEWALDAWIGNPSPVCIHAGQCGGSLVMEHNGDVYACDHCVYPEYKLGNVLAGHLMDMAGTSRKSGFGVTKQTALPRRCRECEVLAACHGGCPKHRFAQSCYGEPGLHYLCAGYRKFFSHIRKYLRVMTTLLENGLPASGVMKAVKGPLVIRCASSKALTGPAGTGP